MTTLFNLCTNLEIVPREWGRNIIIPIHKKGDTRDLNNFRGISLSSVVGKMYNRIIEKEVTNFVESMDILGEIQGGFRKDRRTTDQIYILKGLTTIRKHKN